MARNAYILGSQSRNWTQIHPLWYSRPQSSPVLGIQKQHPETFALPRWISGSAMASHPLTAQPWWWKMMWCPILVCCVWHICVPRFFPAGTNWYGLMMFNVVMVNHFLKAIDQRRTFPQLDAPIGPSFRHRQSAQVITMTAGFRQSLTILAN